MYEHKHNIKAGGRQAERVCANIFCSRGACFHCAFSTLVLVSCSFLVNYYSLFHLLSSLFFMLHFSLLVVWSYPFIGSACLCFLCHAMKVCTELEKMLWSCGAAVATRFSSDRNVSWVHQQPENSALCCAAGWSAILCAKYYCKRNNNLLICSNRRELAFVDWIFIVEGSFIIGHVSQFMAHKWWHSLLLFPF